MISLIALSKDKGLRSADLILQFFMELVDIKFVDIFQIIRGFLGTHSKKRVSNLWTFFVN